MKTLGFGTVVVVLLCCALIAPSNAKGDAEQKTAQLMQQVLTAISSSATAKSSDADSLQKLCDLVNSVQASISQMQVEETADYDFGMARLRAELLVAKANLTTVISLHNATAADLQRHIQNTQIYPRQLAEARERTEALEKQRDLLRRECESDLGGQRLRVDAVKADIAVLDQALEHLEKLAQSGAQNENKDGEKIAMLDISSSSEPEDCVVLPDPTAPMIRCENGHVVTINTENGTIITAPPGNGMNYHNNLKCLFRISPSSAGPLDRIELTVHALNTTSSTDFVRVYDGPVADPALLLLSASGSPAVPPGPIRSRVSNEMLVSFIMSPSSQLPSQGLLASFRVIQIPNLHNTAINMCPHANGQTLILTGDAGFVAEDTRPEFASSLQNKAGSAYSSPIKCRWLIQAEPEQSIRLHFTFLHTRKEVDEIVIYDGSFEQAPQIVRLSGDAIPADIVSSSSALFLTYSSDYTVERSGFHLSWCVSGTSCPASPTPEPLPAVVSIPTQPTPEFNSSAPAVVEATPTAAPTVPPRSPAASTPAPPSPPSPASETIVAPPEYPLPASSSVGLNCCPSGCSNQGVCNPTTCECACYASFTGADCSGVSAASDMAALVANTLLDLGSGLGQGAEEMALATHQVQDECGDEVDDLESMQAVRQLDVDPVRGLLDRLKFELFRSLTYEKDTTNMTKLQCNEDLRAQDRDLQRLQQEVLNLTRLVTEAESKQKELTEKETTLKLQEASLQTYTDELTERIATRQKARDGRVAAQTQETRTLTSMRDIISNMGSYHCTPMGGQQTVSFTKAEGIECAGEVLPIQLSTSDANECQALCGVGCVAFSWNSVEGCRFYSEITSRTSSCSNENGACACFEKAI